MVCYPPLWTLGSPVPGGPLISYPLSRTFSTPPTCVLVAECAASRLVPEVSRDVDVAASAMCDAASVHHNLGGRIILGDLELSADMWPLMPLASVMALLSYE